MARPNGRRARYAAAMARGIPVLVPLLFVWLAAAPVAAKEPAARKRPVPFAGLTPLAIQSPADRDPVRLERLSDLGPVYVRTAPLLWQDVEPDPHRGGAPHYRWDLVDEAVLLWQLSDFDPVIVLSPRNPWACGSKEKSAWVRAVHGALPTAEAKAALGSARGTPAPRADTWAKWERFVRDLVERYDGDGKDDMPGLRRPVLHFQILEDAASPASWLGSVEEYMRLLHHGGLGARRACKQSRVLATGVDVAGTGYDPFPDPREHEFRIERLVPEDAVLARLELARSFRLLETLLNMPALYDVLPQVGNDSHADDVTNLRFLRRSLDEHAGKDVSLWLVDNATLKLGEARTPGAVGPKKGERRLRQRWMSAARNPAHPEHAEALPWMRRGQAFDLLRSLGRARAAGADVVLFCCAWDGRPRRAETAAPGRAGLLSESGRAAPAAGSLRTPAWYALAQAVRLLGGHRSAGETSIGAPGRSVIFHFPAKQDRPWIALLSLDSRLSWAGTPGQALPRRDVLIPLPNGRYVLEACRVGPEAPERRTVVVSNGMLELTMTPAPLYVIPQR